MSMFVHPATGEPLYPVEDAWLADSGERFPIVNGVPRFCDPDNYTNSFGKQWNLFDKTQIDGEGVAGRISEIRLFAETGWTPAALDGEDVLEVGSGAGRFSRVILERTRANLYSVDYSNAVEANWRNNAALGGGRFVLAQASVYDMPFPDNRFDKILCLGVLQHTPDFEASVASLVRKARPGGEIVVDFYPIRGWWTKVHAKYLLRPITRRMSHDKLLGLIERNADWLIAASGFLGRSGLGVLRRFLPVVNIEGTLPDELSREQLREWVVLDTFDMFSPAHDHPQRIAAVAGMFERAGARVSFADYVDAGPSKAAVVRAIKT